MKIKDLPESDRPREKLATQGARRLSDRELLMILLGKGIKGESVMITAQRILGKFRNLKKLSNASVEDLADIKGVGLAKAAQIKAAFEIASRINNGYSNAEPFLKWAGGKNQLLNQYSPLFPVKYNKYLEPFLGGGAVFFHLKPEKAILSDLNKDLILTYQAVRNNVQALIEVLKEFQQKNSRRFYEQIRNDFNNYILNDLERAAAFIYLNKTGFNGLYRVNRIGKFNVPFGNHKNPSIFDEKNLLATSKVLKRATVMSSPFEGVLNSVDSGDFVYFDPPYYPINRTSNFTSYTKDSFLERDQEKLADLFKKLDKKGCKLMLSNSDCEFIRNLYKNYRIEQVKASRFINCNAQKRGPITELIILNY